MTEPRAQRTLVKSPPELWAEVSDVDALARHLGEFGEIRITRLEPETTVAWEGDTARGTVELEASGWGTKVTLTAEVAEAEAEPVAPEPEPEPVAAPPAPGPVAARPEPEPVAAQPEPEPVAAEPEPEPAPEPLPPAASVEAPRQSLFARLFGRRRPEPGPAAAAPEPAPAPEPVAIPEPGPVAVAEPAPGPELTPDEPAAEPGELRPGEPVGERPIDHDRALAVLTGVLDDLGSAHHRPFSR
jgi:hypothetical protein